MAGVSPNPTTILYRGTKKAPPPMPAALLRAAACSCTSSGWVLCWVPARVDHAIAGRTRKDPTKPRHARPVSLNGMSVPSSSSPLCSRWAGCQSTLRAGRWAVHSALNRHILEPPVVLVFAARQHVGRGGPAPDAQDKEPQQRGTRYYAHENGAMLHTPSVSHEWAGGDASKQVVSHGRVHHAAELPLLLLMQSGPLTRPSRAFLALQFKQLSRG